MRTQVRKVRRRDYAALAIEQTRDLAELTPLLAAMGLPAAGLERPSHCCLVARLDGRTVGVAAVETRVDVAVLATLAVIAQMRRRAIGTALLAAARSAAHTRGVRSLYAVAPSSVVQFLRRSGFAAVPMNEAITALGGTFVGHRLLADPVALERCQPWVLDISGDGIVNR